MKIFTVVFYYMAMDKRDMYPVASYINEHIKSFTTYTKAANYKTAIEGMSDYTGEIIETELE